LDVFAEYKLAHCISSGLVFTGEAVPLGPTILNVRSLGLVASVPWSQQRPAPRICCTPLQPAIASPPLLHTTLLVKSGLRRTNRRRGAPLLPASLIAPSTHTTPSGRTPSGALFPVSAQVPRLPEHAAGSVVPRCRPGATPTGARRRKHCSPPPPRRQAYRVNLAASSTDHNHGFVSEPSRDERVSSRSSRLLHRHHPGVEENKTRLWTREDDARFPGPPRRMSTTMRYCMLWRSRSSGGGLAN
jgi:hypothetical protein